MQQIYSSLGFVILTFLKKKHYYKRRVRGPLYLYQIMAEALNSARTEWSQEVYKGSRHHDFIKSPQMFCCTGIDFYNCQHPWLLSGSRSHWPLLVSVTHCTVTQEFGSSVWDHCPPCLSLKQSQGRYLLTFIVDWKFFPQQFSSVTCKTYLGPGLHLWVTQWLFVFSSVCPGHAIFLVILG